MKRKKLLAGMLAAAMVFTGVPTAGVRKLPAKAAEMEVMDDGAAAEADGAEAAASDRTQEVGAARATSDRVIQAPTVAVAAPVNGETLENAAVENNDLEIAFAPEEDITAEQPIDRETIYEKDGGYNAFNGIYNFTSVADNFNMGGGHYPFLIKFAAKMDASVGNGTYSVIGKMNHDYGIQLQRTGDKDYVQVYANTFGGGWPTYKVEISGSHGLTSWREIEVLFDGYRFWISIDGGQNFVLNRTQGVDGNNQLNNHNAHRFAIGYNFSDGTGSAINSNIRLANIQMYRSRSTQAAVQSNASNAKTLAEALVDDILVLDAKADTPAEAFSSNTTWYIGDGSDHNVADIYVEDGTPYTMQTVLTAGDGWRFSEESKPENIQVGELSVEPGSVVISEDGKTMTVTYTHTGEPFYTMGCEYGEDSNDTMGSIHVDHSNVKEGQSATFTAAVKEDSELEAAKFEGWYLDSACTDATLYSSDASVTVENQGADFTLYAKFAWEYKLVDRKTLQDHAKANSWSNTGNDLGAQAAFDGNSVTLWHSWYADHDDGDRNSIVKADVATARSGNKPIYIETGFGRSINVRSIKYEPRLGNTTNNRLKLYVLAAANLADANAEPIDSDFATVSVGEANDAVSFLIDAKNVQATHIRIYCLSVWRASYITASEISVCQQIEDAETSKKEIHSVSTGISGDLGDVENVQVTEKNEFDGTEKSYGISKVLHGNTIRFQASNGADGKFEKWVDAEGNTVSNEPAYEVPVTGDLNLRAVYQPYDTMKQTDYWEKEMAAGTLGDQGEDDIWYYQAKKTDADEWEDLDSNYFNGTVEMDDRTIGKWGEGSGGLTYSKLSKKQITSTERLMGFTWKATTSGYYAVALETPVTARGNQAGVVVNYTSDRSQTGSELLHKELISAGETISEVECRIAKMSAGEYLRITMPKTDLSDAWITGFTPMIVERTAQQYAVQYLKETADAENGNYTNESKQAVIDARDALQEAAGADTPDMADIDAKITALETAIAGLKEKVEYTVTVEAPASILPSEGQEVEISDTISSVTVESMTYVKLQAPATNGTGIEGETVYDMKFVGWLNKDTGKYVSYAPYYSVLVRKNLNLKPVYAKEVTQAPVLEVSGSGLWNGSDRYVYEVTASRTIPIALLKDGQTKLLGHGILVSNTKSGDELTATVSSDGKTVTPAAGVFVSKAKTTTGLVGTYTAKIKSTQTTIHAKAYVIYENKAGEVVIVMGDSFDLTGTGRD